MLNIRHDLPESILKRPAHRLYDALGGPTLVHLKGARTPPLFLSVLMHGNEDTGWRVVQNVLKERGADLPRSLSIFIGNVQAARYGKRRLERQPDYNRIWAGGVDPEHAGEYAMIRKVIQAMRRRGVFASVDIHNNTGINPHYACINRLDAIYLNLAQRFSRMVIYFTRPGGVQSLAFARFCPAVTLECGQPGDEIGIQLTSRYVNELLELESLPQASIDQDSIDLFHTVAVAKVSAGTSISFTDKPAAIRFIRGIEQLNFQEIPAGTVLARVSAEQQPLEVMNEAGELVADDYFEMIDGQLQTRAAIMPSMLTTNEHTVRQDCLCYLMERYDLSRGERPLPHAPIWN